jgi:hypothetical protein
LLKKVSCHFHIFLWDTWKVSKWIYNCCVLYQEMFVWSVLWLMIRSYWFSIYILSNLLMR